MTSRSSAIALLCVDSSFAANNASDKFDTPVVSFVLALDAFQTEHRLLAKSTTKRSSTEPDVRITVARPVVQIGRAEARIRAIVPVAATVHSHEAVKVKLPISDT